MRSATRVLMLLLVLAAYPAQGASKGKEPGNDVKIPVHESTKVRFPGYDPATGDLLWELVAAKVTRDPKQPRVLLGTDVRIVVYHKGQQHIATGKKGSVNTATNSAILQGNVVVLFGDEQATRVETESIEWKGQEGTASTEDPVRISRKDAMIEGLGLRLWLSDTKGAGGVTDRTNHLVIERRVKTVILPGARGSLFTSVEKATPENAKPAEPIVITCAGPLMFYRAEMTAVFRENVRAVQGAQSLTCDMLTVTARWAGGAEAKPAPNPGLKPTPKGAEGAETPAKRKAELDTVTATGNVRLDDTHTIALADAVIWNRRLARVRLIGRPAEVRWDNGNRLSAGVIERSQDGAEFFSSSTPDYPEGVYLVAHTGERSTELFDPKDSPRLRVGDVRGWPAFCSLLSKQGASSTPSAGGRIWELLPPNARTIVGAAAADKSLVRAQKVEIVSALNEILAQRAFYRAQDFQGVAVPPAATKLLAIDAEARTGRQVRELNRMLLEAAFPKHIARREQQAGK